MFTTILHFILFVIIMYTMSGSITSKYKGTLYVQKNTGCIFSCVGDLESKFKISLVSQAAALQACSSLGQKKLIMSPSLLVQASPQQDLRSLEVVERAHTSQTIWLCCNK
jgi:hypothetical protein